MEDLVNLITDLDTRITKRLDLIEQNCDDLAAQIKVIKLNSILYLSKGTSKKKSKSKEKSKSKDREEKKTQKKKPAKKRKANSSEGQVLN